MKKIIATIVFSLVVGKQAIPQDKTGETLNWIAGIAGQVNNVISTFKNSTRYVNIAMEIQKVYNLSNQVNQKYRSVRSMSNYASDRNFIAFFNEGVNAADLHTRSSNDYLTLINQGLAIGEKLVSMIQGGGSVKDNISAGVEIGTMIASGGISSAVKGLLGGSKSDTPDPQKILDNLKANDDMLDKSYRELKDATTILAKLSDDLDTFQNYDNHEKLIKQNSSFYIF